MTTPMPDLTLYVPTRDQVNVVARVLAEAFVDYPLYTYSIPNPKKRLPVLQTLYEVIVTYSMKYGKIYATSNQLEGVMCYLPKEAVILSNWRMVKSGALKIPLKFGFAFLKRVTPVTAKFDQQWAKYANFPHTYLWNIGVQPDQKGKGHASRLIRSLLADLAARNEPCYLGTVLERNVRIYEHLGFQVMETCVIPEAHLTSWAMIWQKE